VSWWPGGERSCAYVFHVRPNVPKRLRDLIDGRMEIVHIDDPFMWTQTDFYVMNSALNSRSEAAAARVGLMPIVLPQMNDYLAAQIKERAHHDIYIFMASHVGEVPPIGASHRI